MTAAAVTLAALTGALAVRRHPDTADFIWETVVGHFAPGDRLAHNDNWCAR